MRDGKASRTAMFVAWARGLGTGVSRPGPLRAGGLARGAVGSAASDASLADGDGARTRAGPGGDGGDGRPRQPAHRGDRRRPCGAAVEDGVDQLVVLGAGLDGRAWRLAWLGGVDRASRWTIPARRRSSARRRAVYRWPARSVRFVSVDFATQRLADRLAETHDPARRTFWIWEGVTPYLPPEAIDATLADVAERSHSGSVLAATYGTPSRTPITLPGLVPRDRLRLRRYRRAAAGAVDPAPDGRAAAPPRLRGRRRHRPKSLGRGPQARAGAGRSPSAPNASQKPSASESPRGRGRGRGRPPRTTSALVWLPQRLRPLLEVHHRRLRQIRRRRHLFHLLRQVLPRPRQPTPHRALGNAEHPPRAPLVDMPSQ